jgi:hypothetical protein
MGFSKSKSKTTNEPAAWAKPYIEKGLQQSGRVFDEQQPMLDAFSKAQMDTYGRVAPGAEQGIIGAQGVVNDNLSGKNLNGNPYLEAIIDRTRENVTNGVNDQFGPAGRFGSGMHAKILGDELANAENNLRFQNYGVERGYQQSAIGDAQNLMGGAQGMLNNAAELPWLGVGALNGNVRQASNGYGTQTTKQSNPWGPAFGQFLGSAASMASDPRLKTNIVQVGAFGDGLGIYEWDYIDPPTPELAPYMPAGRQQGVMADEVALLRPNALGLVVSGYATVDYGAL